jgi:hypothetical protein
MGVLFLIALLFKRVTGTAVFPFAMMALTEDRDTPSRDGRRFSYPVAATKLIYAGSIVVLNATGYAEPATAAVAKKALGRACAQVDNSAGANGDLSVEVEEGVFRYSNSAGGDEVTLAEVGSACFLVDDGTVAKTSAGGTRSVAGYIRDVDANGVWVEIRNVYSADGDLVAANNLSDVASAATARANLAANKIVLDLEVADLTSASAKVYRVVSPVAGTIKKIYSVIDGPLTVGDATLAGKIGAVAITNGVITITQAGSAAGDVDVATPTAANVVAVDDVISVTVGGTNTAAKSAKVTIYIET